MKQFFYDDHDLQPRLAGRSIFLAGPTARGVPRTPWRARALELLAEAAYDGLVVLPEFRDGRFDERAPRVFDRGESPAPNLRRQSFHVLRWETIGIELSSTVLFWMPFTLASPEDPASLPGFTTRAEVSRELARDPGRLVLGMPPGALAGGHIRYHAHVAGVRVHETLEETVRAAVAREDRRRGVVDPVRICLSHVPQDRELRDRLAGFLSLLVGRKQVSFAGVEEADVIVMLLSIDYLVADAEPSSESQVALARVGRREARIVPVVLRPCPFERTWIGNYQPLPRGDQRQPNRPVTSWPNVDEALQGVFREISDLVDAMRGVGRATRAR